MTDFVDNAQIIFVHLYIFNVFMFKLGLGGDIVCVHMYVYMCTQIYKENGYWMAGAHIQGKWISIGQSIHPFIVVISTIFSLKLYLHVLNHKT